MIEISLAGFSIIIDAILLIFFSLATLINIFLATTIVDVFSSVSSRELKISSPNSPSKSSINVGLSLYAIFPPIKIWLFYLYFLHLLLFSIYLFLNHHLYF